jgi:hypothetical protein
VDASSPSNNSDSGFDFVHVKSVMKVDAANHSIIQHHENPGKPKSVGIPHHNSAKNRVSNTTENI